MTDPFDYRCGCCGRPLVTVDGSDPGGFCNAECEAQLVLARAKRSRTLRAVLGAPAAALRWLGLVA
jgi:hypothetical protein